MKSFYCQFAVILILNFLFGHIAVGQSYNRISTDDAFNTMEAHFKTNQALVNGVLFVDKYRNDVGHPFLNSPYFSEGILNLNNLEYTECKLGYNLVDQKIVVVEKNDVKIKNPFIPPVEFIDSFQISEMVFKKSNEENRFYLQVFESKQFNILAYLYKKSTKSYHKKNVLAYKHSEVIADIFVVIDNTKYKVATKRNYVSLFPSKIEKPLSSFIKKYRLSFKKSDISELNTLFNYTQELLQSKEISLDLKTPQAR